MSSEYKYRAFISYSHKDEKWASWLHKALETFKIPKYLVGETTSMGTIPERMGKVFRDREELSPGRTTVRHDHLCARVHPNLAGPLPPVQWSTEIALRWRNSDNPRNTTIAI